MAKNKGISSASALRSGRHCRRRAKRWVVRVALPLSELLPDGVRPGDRIYMNFFRAMWIRDVFAWSPTFTELHELSRLGEVVLAK